MTAAACDLRSELGGRDCGRCIACLVARLATERAARERAEAERDEAKRRVAELEEQVTYHQSGHRQANEIAMREQGGRLELAQEVFALRRRARRWKALAKKLRNQSRYAEFRRGLAFRSYQNEVNARRSDADAYDSIVAAANAERRAAESRLALAEALLKEAHARRVDADLEERIDAFLAKRDLKQG